MSVNSNLPPIDNGSQARQTPGSSEQKGRFGIRRGIRNFAHTIVHRPTGSPSQASTPLEMERFTRIDTPPAETEELLKQFKVVSSKEKIESPQRQASSSSPDTNSLKSTAERKARRMGGNYTDLASSLRDSGELQSNSSPLASSSSHHSSDSPEQRSSSLRSSSPPLTESPPASPERLLLPEEKEEFAAEMARYGCAVSDDELSDLTQSEAKWILTFMQHGEGSKAESSRSSTVGLDDWVEITPESAKSSEHAKFKLLYTAVAGSSVNVPETVPATFKYTDSTDDKGGHGGTKKATFEHGGKTYYLFLKPADQAEIRGYTLTNFFDERRKQNPNKAAHQVGNFMPQTYGTVIIDNREYLVMEDITEGGRNRPIMDAKFSYRIGNLNPIASKAEILATGRTKHTLDRAQMKLGAMLAGGYMIYHPDKLKRLMKFKDSQTVFKEKLRDNYSQQQLENMRTQLLDLQEALAAGEIAYIGSSILFLEGGIKLIDPAHPHTNPEEQGNLKNQPNIYFGANQRDFLAQQEEFAARKASMVASIDVMLADMDDVIREHQEDGFLLNTGSQAKPR